MILVYSLNSYTYPTVAKDESKTWTVTFQSACAISTIQALSTFTTMTNAVAGSSICQPFSDVQDSASQTYDVTPLTYTVTSFTSTSSVAVTAGPVKGTTYCGARAYTITGPTPCNALTISTNTTPFYPYLVLAPTLPAQVTPGTACTITCKLSSYSMVI